MPFHRPLDRCFAPIISLVLTLLAAGSATAQITPELVIENLASPVRLVSPTDDPRLFVVEQDGLIRIFRRDGTDLGVFLDLTAETNLSGERGLLGLAFPPDYDESGRFYVNYTGNDGDTRIARYTVDPGNRDRADPTSAEIILRVDQPFSNHNGGHLEFGSDAMLYIGLGDGGSGGDPGNRAQNDALLLGKMLRIDVSVGSGYAIPSGNPFIGQPPLDEIWAKGLRNPWTYAFDSLTGDLYICDVGQSEIEEVDVQPAGSLGGENYGWRLMEGSECFNPPSNCNDGSLTLPDHEYTHGGSPFRCSISGGQVYRGPSIPAIAGHFFFADYCSNQIWSITWAPGQGVTSFQEWTTQATPPGGYGAIASIGRDAVGELYVLDRDTGRVYRFVSDTTHTGDTPPSGLALEQNIPNPFNPRTEIGYRVPENGAHVQLHIHDLSGRLVRTLIDGNVAEGRHVAVWDGLNDRGRGVAAGVYVYTLSHSGVSLRRTMALVR